MKLDDEFGLLEIFNDACYEMARAIQDGMADKYIANGDVEFILDELVVIEQVEDWWNISIETNDITARHDFFTLYVNRLREYFPSERDEYFDNARQMLKDFNIYSSHFDAKLDRVEIETLPEKIRYLPHIVTYLDNVFESYRGFEVLKNELAEEGLEPKIYFTPVQDENRQPENLNLDTPNVYRLVLMARKKDDNTLKSSIIRPS